MQGSEEGCDNSSGLSFSQSGTQHIPAMWILLDNQSMVDLFCNSRLLKNIRQSTTRMNIQCNTGQWTMNMIGNLPGYGTVWYNLNSIRNILSLCCVASKYHVMYDSQGGSPNPNDPDGGGSFVVTKPNSTMFEFKASPGGLYFLNTECASTVLINTVADNKAKYTNEDYLKALTARQLQIKIS